MTTDPRKAYRQQQIQTGSLPDIFVHAYDRVVSLLHSAAAATEARDIETKTLDLTRALNIIVHLQGALDFEHGGEVARNLDRFYTLLRGEIFKGSAKLDAATLRQAAGHVVEIRKIWELAQALDSSTASASSAPAQFPHSQFLIPASDSRAQNPSSQTGQSGSWSA
ncbi:MAG: flagellar export chaperone FliS [Terriglobia bacterium]